MNRDPVETYWKLIDKFAQCPTGKVRHFVYPPYADHESDVSVLVSHAHRVCLCYLIWLGEQNLEACETFLEAAVTWRKQAGRYATARTAIEKLARIMRRKTLPKLRKQRAQSLGGAKAMQRQMAEGIGIFHPDYPPERRRETGRMGAAITNSKPRNLWCKRWLVTDPDGNEFEIENLSLFCREMEIDYQYLKQREDRTRKVRPGQYNCRPLG